MNRLFLVFLFLPFFAYTQSKFPEHPEPEEARNKGAAILANFLFGFHLPGGDMADRFGNDGNFGVGVQWMTASNWAFGFEGHYLFGQQVQEDPLAIIRTPEGDIIGNDRVVAGVFLRQRGWYAGGVVSKLFAPESGKRSGIRASFGAGWLQHKIRIQDDSRAVTQLTGDYKKGYDRLTGGPALQQSIGWQHLAANRRANWYIGLEFQQGFTNTLRDWDFNLRRKLDENRLDLRFGIRAAWTLPFYQEKAATIFY